LIDGLIAIHHGRVFGAAGDSVVAEFASPVSAVRCAVEIQQSLEKKNAQLPEGQGMRFRIGVNLGDVMVEGDNLLGEGVNVAARLEGLAEPGGVCIAANVFEQVENKLPLGYAFLGEQEVKNIAKPVRVYKVLVASETMGKVFDAPRAKRPSWRLMSAVGAAAAAAVAGIVLWQQPWKSAVEPASTTVAAPQSSSKPAIAILPFHNMSDDPKQDYLADGIADDLITDLTKLSGLVVVARDSSRNYKDESPDFREVARALQVSHVLHGSVRRVNSLVRINAQLIEADTGRHIWAERYDGSMSEIFGLQEKINKEVVSALSIKLTTEEHRDLGSPDTNNLQAYEYFLQGRGRFLQFSRDDTRESRYLLQKAIDLDPQFATAYAVLAWTHVFDAMNGWSDDRNHSLKLGRSLAKKALALNGRLPLAYFVSGLSYREQGDYVKALVEGEKATDIDPNYANAHVLVATLMYYSGRPEEGLERMKLAMRLNPHHPHNYPFHVGQAYFIMGRYQEAIEAFQRGLESRPTSERLRLWLAAAYAQAGQLDDAEWQREEVLISNPQFSLQNIERAFPFKDPRDREHFMAGLRKAGFS
jgi:TolB-like protein